MARDLRSANGERGAPGRSGPVVDRDAILVDSDFRPLAETGNERVFDFDSQLLREPAAKLVEFVAIALVAGS